MKVHKQRLVNKKCYSEEEVHLVVEDAEKYKEINRERPGFFDVAINTGKPTASIVHSNTHVLFKDSLSEGYQRLKVLVMAYGGITPDSSASSRPGTQLTMTTSTSSKPLTSSISWSTLFAL